MTPIHVQCIDHVVLRVTDLQRSVDCYKRVLDCEVAKTRPDLGLIYLRAEVSMIDPFDKSPRYPERR